MFIYVYYICFFLYFSKKVAAKLNALGPGKCIAIPADLQNLDDLNKLVTELSKRESRKYSSIIFFSFFFLIDQLDSLWSVCVV